MTHGLADPNFGLPIHAIVSPAELDTVLENGEFTLFVVGEQEEEFDFRNLTFLVTDGYGNLARISFMLGLSGQFRVRTEVVEFDDDGKESVVFRSIDGLFKAERD